MTTEEAAGRLNLFDDPSPLPNTKNINILVEGIRKKTRGAVFVSLLRKHLKSRTKQHPRTVMRIWKLQRPEVDLTHFRKIL